MNQLGLREKISLPEHRAKVIVGAACALALAMLLSCGLGSLVTYLAVSPSKSKGGGAPGKTYTRNEFETAVAGLSTAELRQKLGTPVKVENPTFERVDGREGYWLYENLTVNPQTQKTDPVVHIWIVNGRVSHVSW